mmetsp:Transcript_28589/g.62428  ORF Transcript_28589/g.62428 Transcript_28589/m.62428 type:complete len:366 (+) Transcript_28589:61-1158(+)
MEEKLLSVLTCLVYGFGIIFCLGIYGVIQERIMSEPYKAEDGREEWFKVSVFLVLCNRLVAIVYAVFMVWFKDEEFANKAPLWKYIAISFSNVSATWCQYEALKYVSFPVQMLGKSFKMMPVMLWGIVISQKKYKLQDWLIAGGVTFGVTFFLLTGDIKSKHANAGTSSYGLGLLVCFLAFDGFTSTFQEKLFKEHKTSKYNQMLYVNSGSATVSLSSLVLSGAAPRALSFCIAHPDFTIHAGSLSAAAVAGQFFIYSQVKEFGALVFAATMNLRQVISILMSYMMYGHSITALQLVGLTAVFGTLFYKSYLGYLKQGEPKEEANGHKPKPVEGKEAKAVPGEDLELVGSGPPKPEVVGAQAPAE